VGLKTSIMGAQGRGPGGKAGGSASAERGGAGDLSFSSTGPYASPVLKVVPGAVIEGRDHRCVWRAHQVPSRDMPRRENSNSRT